MLAVDADLNPMLGVSLGVGADADRVVVSARQAVATGDAEHAPTLEAIVERFGADAPDGVRLVVATRLEVIDPGCMCCGVNPAKLVRELEHGDRTVVCDLEAGLGTVERLEAGHADVAARRRQPDRRSRSTSRAARSSSPPASRRSSSSPTASATSPTSSSSARCSAIASSS